MNAPNQQQVQQQKQQAPAASSKEPSIGQYLTNAVQSLVALKSKLEADAKELTELRAFKKATEKAAKK